MYVPSSNFELLVTCLTIPKNLSHSCSKEKQLFDSEEELDEISERPTTRNVSNQSNTAPITGQAKVRGKIKKKRRQKAREKKTTYVNSSVKGQRN